MTKKKYIPKVVDKALKADEENTIQPFAPSPHHKPKYKPSVSTKRSAPLESQDADRNNKIRHNKAQEKWE
jgi:hypothetical protein